MRPIDQLYTYKTLGLTIFVRLFCQLKLLPIKSLLDSFDMESLQLKFVIIFYSFRAIYKVVIFGGFFKVVKQHC